MQLPNDEPPLCALCGDKSATEEYTRAGHTETVRATCLDRWNVQDVMEDSLLHIEALRRRGQHDEALALVDAILESNRHRDRDGWLARSSAHDRAVILFDAGRYTEAEQAYHAWARLGFEDVSQRWMHALGMAHTLEALDRDREAVAALEDGLGYEDPKYLPSVAGVLTELVRFSEKLALPIDPKWLRIAKAVAEHYGVDMPVHDSAGQAILTLAKTVRSMAPKRPSE